MMISLKKRLRKKGFFSHIQFAILAIVAIIVFILFLAKTYDKVADKMAAQDCKNSIAAHSLIAKGSFSEIFTDIKCPTREVTIKKLSKTNEMIAEDMHRCWYIWGEGEGQYFQGEGTFCHVCSVYQFGDKGRTVSGLNRYLINTDVPVRYPGEVSGIKYIDYFQGYSSPNADRKVDNSIQVPVEIDTIDTSERYATIFVYASGKDSIDKMLEGGKRTTAAAGLVTLGTAGAIGSGIVSKIGVAAASGTAATASTTGGAALTTVTIFNSAGGVASTVQTIVSGGYITTELGILVPAASKAGEALLASQLTAGTGTVAGTGGAVLGITPIGWVVIGTGVLVLTGVGIYMVLDTPDPEWMSYVAFRPYNPGEFEALGCDKMAVNQMSNVGR